MTTHGFWLQLKRRGVARAAATYLVTSWLILEVGHLLSLILEMPHFVMRFVLVLLVLGFPVAMVLAWNYRTMAAGAMDVELPETDPAARAEHELHEAAHAHSGHGHGGHGAHGGGESIDPLPFIVGGLVVAGLLFLGATRIFGFVSGDSDSPAASGHGAATAPAAVSHAPAAAPANAAPKNSIAVLAFANLSGDPKQDYFSDGLSEELIDALARNSRLQVAARTSSFAFKGKGADAATIGAKLGTTWLLDGSVRRDGDKIRVSTQLVDARTGFKAWAETYDRQYKDIFEVQRGIADAVAQALQLKLDASSAPVGGTLNQNAYDAYLRGRQLAELSGDETQWRSALESFDAAIAADPNYAAAHSARAWALVQLGAVFLPDAEVPASADAALVSARRAVELAPESADTQSMLGYVLTQAKLDFAGAEAPFEKSMQLGSGNATILLRYGTFALRDGRTEAGVSALVRAAELDPLNSRVQRQLAIAQFAARRYADSIASMRRGLTLNPAMSNAHFYIGNSLMGLGDMAGAAREFAAEPVGWARLTGQAVLAARTGKTAEARALMAQMVKANGRSLYQSAEILAQIGDRDAALTALEEALAHKDAGMVSLRYDPLLDPLRGEARFKALVAKMFG